MSVLSKEEAKAFLKIDYSDEDTDIQALIDAAEVYLKNAGCTLNANDEVAKLAEKMLVNHWYSNREPTGSTNLLAFGLQSLIAQLKYCYDTSTTTNVTSTT